MSNRLIQILNFLCPRMHTPAPTYRSLVPSRENPRRHAGDDWSGCPHTYGVRLGPCGSLATNTCRPTACAKRDTPAPYPSTANSKLLTPNWFYTFSAKEKDSETGLSYFGSRYYSSDLSIWLSVDPMSDKYASLSPYVYCADNPIKLVDPNGEEIYVFNENGEYIERRGEEGSPDQIAIIKSNGELCKSMEYSNGTIQLGPKGFVKQHNGNIVSVQSLRIKGDNNALDCFKFVSDNSSVEWCLIRTGVKREEATGVNYLSNSQEIEHENSLNIFTSNSTIRIREHWHSHPDGDLRPSTNDYKSAELFRDLNGLRYGSFRYIPTFIYSQGRSNEYSPLIKILEDDLNNALKEWGNMKFQ